MRAGLVRAGFMATAAAVLAALVAIVAVNAVSGGGPPPASVAGAVGASPAFRLGRLGHPGETVSLAQRRGGPVVVTFFASWCSPCRRELPLLASAAAAKPSVAFLGVDVADRPSSAQEMVRQAGVTFPVGVDGDNAVSAAVFHLRGLPSTVFVDPTGKVVGVTTGAVTKEGLAAAVSRLAPGQS